MSYYKVFFGIGILSVVLLMARGCPVALAAEQNQLRRVEVLGEPGESLVLVETDSDFMHFTKSMQEGRVLVVDLAGVYVGDGGGTQVVGRNGVRFIRHSQYRQEPPVVRVVIGYDAGTPQQIRQKGTKLEIVQRYSEGSIRAAALAEWSASREIEMSARQPVQKPDLNHSALEQSLDRFRDIPEDAEGLISLNFRAVPMHDLLGILSAETGINLLPDKTVSNASVAFSVDNVTGLQALELLLLTEELDYWEYSTNARIITRKGRALSYDTRRVQRHFLLIDAEPRDIVRLIENNDHLRAEIDLNNISIDDRLKSVFIYDRPEVVELLEEVINDFDRKRRQCSIELRLVELYTDAARDLGFQMKNLPMGFEDILRMPDHIPLAATLHALAEKRKARVLSSPRIRVVDGMEGVLRVGESVPVPYYSYEEAGRFLQDAQNVRVAQPIRNYRRDEVGIELKVRPTIYDDRQVALNLNISVSDILSVTADQQLHTTTRSTNTHVRVRHGETVILGGLVKKHHRNQNTSVPLIDRIPILSDIFSRRQNSARDSEMVMFITTHLVNEDDKSSAPDRMIESGHFSEQKGLSSKINKVTADLAEAVYQD